MPLEAYKERYTQQWSGAKTGWLERRWTEAGIAYVRVDGDPLLENRPIKAGSVVDATGRSKYTFTQIIRLLGMIESGSITDNDVIYFDDFWTPGMEALPYAFDLMGVHPKMFAFLHAQSVDRYDFTAPMRGWIREIEKGYANMLTGIFVCCPTLKGLVTQDRDWSSQHAYGHDPICSNPYKVIVTGHPFAEDEVMSRMPETYRLFMEGRLPVHPRRNKVVWSSRWDREKNPSFFLHLAGEVKTDPKFKDTEFVVCTAAAKMRSNDPEALRLLHLAAGAGVVTLKENLTKEEYYAELTSAKVQFNSADQDFVAITLLEALTAGCYPVYPNFRSFPETFRSMPNRGQQFLYEHLDLGSAIDAVKKVLAIESAHWTRKAIEDRSAIYKPFNNSWKRMLNFMGFNMGSVEAAFPPV